MGCKSGVAKGIQDIQLKAQPTHCYAHSLSLSVKDAANCNLLSDTTDTAKEITILIKFSQTRENLLGEIKENIERADNTTVKGILKFCPTRWIVRASRFNRIMRTMHFAIDSQKAEQSG